MARKTIGEILKYITVTVIISITILSCKNDIKPQEVSTSKSRPISYSDNILDYRITPSDSLDKSGLMFSDQGAWFAFSLPDSTSNISGFTGPFLLTEQNGIWASKCLANLNIKGSNNTKLIDWQTSKSFYNGSASHLEQAFENDSLHVIQRLYFITGNTALMRTTITNISQNGMTIHPSMSGELYNIGVSVTEKNETIILSSEKSTAKGYLKFGDASASIMTAKNYYNAHFETAFLNPDEALIIDVSQTYIFPEYSWDEEERHIQDTNFEKSLKVRVNEKSIQLESLLQNRKEAFSEEKYSEVLAKSHLTLQNNWRIPAGEIKHDGLFPSYHYKWFNGFWSWDSWKHAAGLSYYNPSLAKKQIELMFEFQNENGFVADCVFRDTLVENHNYRDTKPPLAVWAVYKVFEKENDVEFIKRMYPKLKLYHEWWYQDRDSDKDGLCEYGSTDGSLVAAKWESGMDNAVRFDNAKILKNAEGAFSLNQESVDLNSYLYAEKLYLAALADVLFKPEEAIFWMEGAEDLKTKIQEQFYDSSDRWFYDTSIDGLTFIKAKGSEGWTPLWAEVATQEQAEQVKNSMMNPEEFFVKVPFQTLAANHEKFNPLKGYWRGPNWLDQAYFGVEGLRNYGFNSEANAATVNIIAGANGLLGKGQSIRENYHPITGEGLNAKNFSWSAAHLIMLLQRD